MIITTLMSFSKMYLGLKEPQYIRKTSNYFFQLFHTLSIQFLKNHLIYFHLPCTFSQNFCTWSLVPVAASPPFPTNPDSMANNLAEGRRIQTTSHQSYCLQNRRNFELIHACTCICKSKTYHMRMYLLAHRKK